MATPTFKLYGANGSTLVYTFDYVTDETGLWDDPVNYSEHTSLRGQGSIISEGGLSPFDLSLTFILKGTDYYNLTEKIDDVQTKIVKFTPYILKVSKTLSTVRSIKVKRISPILFPYTYKQKRINIQNGVITFRASSW